MGSMCSSQPLVMETEADPKRLVTQFSKLTSLKKQFEFICQLGNGAFGKVRLYRDIYFKDMLYAIKTLKKEGIPKAQYDLLIAEVKILSELDHPNIVKYYGTFEDGLYLHIVMEYLKGDDLTKIITLKDYNDLDERDMCQIIHQLLKAVLFIHNKNIVHRDIKPENILFGKKKDYSTLKLIDFGLATNTQTKKKGSAGSPYYMAPEVIRGGFCKKSDIWSIGVVLYLMLTGKHPFEVKSHRDDIFEIILNKKYDVSELDKCECSEEAKDIVIKTLVKDPEKRLSTEECLKHPWFKKYASNEASLITMNTVSTIKKFSKKSPIQKELFYFIAKITREEEIKKLKEIFNEVDTRNDGTIKIDELRTIFSSQGVSINEKDLEVIWEGLDFHGDGKVNYTEFIAALISQYRYTDDKKLFTMFNFFTGSIEEDEIITYDLLIKKAKSLNIRLNEKALKANFALFKAEGKKITFEVFKDLINPEM